MSYTLKTLYLIAVLFITIFTTNASDRFPLAGAVEINTNSKTAHSFFCNNRKYRIDFKIPSFHGCDVETVNFGPSGAKAHIITLHYGWQKQGEANTPKVTYMIELPDGTIYRIAHPAFLLSDQPKRYFQRISGYMGGNVTNINLKRFSERHLEIYGSTLCLSHHLKHPFKGKFGWCQGDMLMSGEASYLKGAMDFTRAALIASDFFMENNIAIAGERLLSPHTMTALNITPSGWYYYAFGVKGKVSAHSPERYYTLRVFFNGRTELNERSSFPLSPAEL